MIPTQSAERPQGEEAADSALLLAKHPCYSHAAHRRYGRIHLPVAEHCNLGCNYCERRIGGPTYHTYRPAVALLGAILVYKYGWITQQQLNHALERQRREGPGRPRLGEILLDTGAISPHRLEQALEHQRTLLQERGAPVT